MFGRLERRWNEEKERTKEENHQEEAPDKEKEEKEEEKKGGGMKNSLKKTIREGAIASWILLPYVVMALIGTGLFLNTLANT